MDHYSYPKELKKLRACVRCSLLKTYDQVSNMFNYQFKESGCENCNADLDVKSNNQFANNYTTTNFKGIMVITNPKFSWAARWNHKSNY